MNAQHRQQKEWWDLFFQNPRAFAEAEGQLGVAMCSLAHFYQISEEHGLNLPAGHAGRRDLRVAYNRIDRAWSPAVLVSEALDAAGLYVRDGTIYKARDEAHTIFNGTIPYPTPADMGSSSPAWQWNQEKIVRYVCQAISTP